MLRIKNHKQRELFDPWAFLSPKRRRMLDQGWPGLFKNAILTELPVIKIAPFFKSDFGRPTKELYTAIGVLVLQQTFDLTDEEAIDQLAFNIQWHYALNIDEESDSAKYMCPKTLWNMRSIIVDNDLEQTIFSAATNNLAKIFKVNTEKQRIDSVHIKSNMRRLGRIGIFVTGIHKFLKNLKRQYNAQFEAVDTALVEKYLPEKSLSCFSMVKPSEAQKTLSAVSNDLFDLLQQFKDQSQITGMHSYKLLERILNEQCNLTTLETGKKIEVRPPKEVPSDSLQNPSDPDATYSGHKGQGYQVQVMETYTETGDKDTKAKILNLITHVEVEPAHKSDANALIPAIESVKKRDLSPEEILADSLYGSDENQQHAKQLGVEVVAPTMGDPKKDTIPLSEFKTNRSGKIINCPQGHSPVIVKKKKECHCSAFDLDHCSSCPKQAACPAVRGKKHYYLRYTEKQMRIAQRRVIEKSDEFKDRYRWRAGVEATMSEYDRRTGVKRLRVRGYKSVRFCATLKALGINILRAVAVLMALNRTNEGDRRNRSGINNSISIFKEQLIVILSSINHFLNIYQIFSKKIKATFRIYDKYACQY
jgi:hypothetical protein